MSSLSVDTRLMALLPLLLAGLLVGTALIGSLLPPMAKGWIVRWLFLPLNFCLSAGMLAHLLFARDAERTFFNFLIASGGMALSIWLFLRGRKANSKLLPEMGTSE